MPSHLIEGLFPTREVHLIGGPSGSGKTTLIMQMLKDWRQGLPVFGMKSNPAPFAYVACDRSMQSIQATLDRISIKLDFPLFSLVDQPKMDLSEMARQKFKFLIMDGLPSMVPEGRINDYGAVAEFLRDLTRGCQKYDMTILGSGHATKVREGEKFQNPRQRFLGSVAWGGYSDTMMLVEPGNPEDVCDPTRTVLLLPRNSPGQLLNYRFNEDGVLICQEEVGAITLEEDLMKMGPGIKIFTMQLTDLAHRHKITDRTMFRVVKRMISEGKMLKLTHGVYQLAHSS